ATHPDASSLSDALPVASWAVTGGNPGGPDVWPRVQPEVSKSAATIAADVARMECLTLFRRDWIRAQPVMSAQHYTQKKSEDQTTSPRPSTILWRVTTYRRTPYATQTRSLLALAAHADDVSRPRGAAPADPPLTNHVTTGPHL